MKKKAAEGCASDFILPPSSFPFSLRQTLRLLPFLRV